MYRMAFHLTVADTLGPVHLQLITCTPKWQPCRPFHVLLSRKKTQLLNKPAVVLNEKGYNLYVPPTAANFLDVFVSC